MTFAKLGATSGAPHQLHRSIVMRTLAAILGWLLVALGGVLVFAGLLSLPDGGLMFALPYVFLLPGIVCLGLGALALRLSKHRSRPDAGA